MLLKDTQVRLDRILKDIIGDYRYVRLFGFLPTRCQPDVLVSQLEMNVEIAVGTSELVDKTDDGIKVFLRQRVLDNTTSVVNALFDALEDK